MFDVPIQVGKVGALVMSIGGEIHPFVGSEVMVAIVYPKRRIHDAGGMSVDEHKDVGRRLGDGVDVAVGGITKRLRDAIEPDAHVVAVKAGDVSCKAEFG